MKVIFLDVDGVLNTHKTKDIFKGCYGVDDEHIKWLKKIVDSVGAKIVLSSTWREVSDFAGYLRARLKKYGLEIYSDTPSIDWRRREEEIRLWLKRNPADDFVILDDIDFYPTLQKNYVRVNGLKEEDADRAIEMLGGNK